MPSLSASAAAGGQPFSWSPPRRAVAQVAEGIGGMTNGVAEGLGGMTNGVAEGLGGIGQEARARARQLRSAARAALLVFVLACSRSNPTMVKQGVEPTPEAGRQAASATRAYGRAPRRF